MNSGENYGINSSTFEEVMENNNTISNPEAKRNDEQDKGVGEKAGNTVNLENTINKAGQNAAANTVKSKNIFEIFLSHKKANAIVAGLFTTFLVGCGKASVDTADKDVNAGQANLPSVESVINTDNEKTEVPDIQVSIREPETVADSYTNHTEYEVAPGIKDGYDKPGMFVEAGGMRFADAGKVGEHLAETMDGWNELSADDQAKEIIKNVAENQTESLADYYCQLPDDLRPISLKAIKDEATMEKAIENLSDEEYGKVLNNFKNRVDESKVGETTLNGTYYNAYMYCADADKKSNPSHEDVELVHTKTQESNYSATTLTLRDGTVVKFKLNHDIDDNGENKWGGCVQSVDIDSAAYETTSYSSLGEDVSGAEEITDSAPGETTIGSAPGEDTGSAPGEDTGSAPGEDTGSAPGEDTGSAPGEETISSDEITLTGKDPFAEQANMGNNYTDVKPLDENVTSETTKEEDKQNFTSIVEQKNEDTKIEQTNEEIKTEQAAKEKEAAEPAAEKRVEEEKREKNAANEADADKDNEKADAGASKTQAAAAETENANAAAAAAAQEGQNNAETVVDDQIAASGANHNATGAARANLED